MTPPDRTPAYLGALALLAALSAAAPAAAETRALVVGIDRYQHYRSLEGAVADARDLAQALQRAGVGDLTVLLDEQADFDRIAAAWRGMIERAQAGDDLVFTYAGHGTQVPERVAKSEADKRDELLVLGGFDTEGPGLKQQVLDDVLNQWLKEAGLKGAKVLVAIDACHSGTAFRRVDPRAGAPSYRFLDISISAERLEIPLPLERRTVDETDLPHLTFLAAGQDDQAVPEILLADREGAKRKRGALSWAVARAVEGAADADRDGTITRGELYDFVEGKVRELAEAKHTPNFWPLGGRGTRLVAAPTAAPQAEAPESPVQVAIINADVAVRPMLEANLRRARLVDDKAAAELVWDARLRQIVTSHGDIAAEGIAAGDLQQVIDKELALRRLRASVDAAKLRTRVLPDDRTHYQHDRVSVAIDGVEQPYLTLFNLASTGAVQVLFPTEGDPPTVPVGRRFEIGALEVVPPFGVDHVVAVATARAPDGLRAKLRALDQRPAALEAVEAALALASEHGTQMSVQGVFTGAR